MLEPIYFGTPPQGFPLGGPTFVDVINPIEAGGRKGLAMSVQAGTGVNISITQPAMGYIRVVSEIGGASSIIFQGAISYIYFTPLIMLDGPFRKIRVLGATQSTLGSLAPLNVFVQGVIS